MILDVLRQHCAMVVIDFGCKNYDMERIKLHDKTFRPFLPNVELGRNYKDIYVIDNE